MPRSNSRPRNETRQHRKENTTHTPIRETAINNQPAEKTQPNRDSTPSQPGPAGQFTTQEERGLPVRTTLDWLTLHANPSDPPGLIAIPRPHRSRDLTHAQYRPHCACKHGTACACKEDPDVIWSISAFIGKTQASNKLTKEQPQA